MSVKIIQGEDRTLTVQLKDGDGANLDLTQYVGQTVDACFVGSSGTVSVSLGAGVTIVSPEECGKLTIALSDTNTAALDTDSKDFEIKLTNGSAETRIVQLTGVLDVKEQIC